MKNIALVSIIIIFLISNLGFSQELTGKSMLFELEQPVLKPVIFGEGVISIPGSRERDICISKDGQEMFFSRDGKIMTVRQNSTGWGTPQVAPFSGEFTEYEAQLTLDGESLYYISRRPVQTPGEPEPWQLWSTKRTGSGWETPQRVNDLGDFYPSFTESGYMYFTSADNDIYRSKINNGLLADREKLPETINTDGPEYNAFVAPDETYLIFTANNHPGQLGGGDLYISFRSEDGKWGSPKNMGPGGNSTELDYCPYVSPDGKYLFFARREGREENIYWLDASLIDLLRTADLEFLPEFMEIIYKYDIQQALKYYNEYKAKYYHIADYNGDLLEAGKNGLLKDGLIDSAYELLKYIHTAYPGKKTLVSSIEEDVLSGTDNRMISDRVGFSKDSWPGNFEQQVNIMGYRYIAHGLPELAASIFSLNCEFHPMSANVFDSYGESLAALGDTTGAITNYQKSLELNPKNENAARILGKLMKANGE